MILIVGGSYQGKTEFARTTFPNAKYYNQLHLLIKRRLEEEKSQEDILQEIKEAVSEGQWVVISDEIGNGVVPMESSEREWREVTGRILIELAKKATEVYRVVCGVGTKIK